MARIPCLMNEKYGQMGGCLSPPVKTCNGCLNLDAGFRAASKFTEKSKKINEFPLWK